MSTNCIRCLTNPRTGWDLLCDQCRELGPRSLAGLPADLREWARILAGTAIQEFLSVQGYKADCLLFDLRRAAAGIEDLQTYLVASTKPRTKP